MPTTTDKLSIKKAIAERLTAEGWSRKADTDLDYARFVVEKDYDTAVGKKTAVIALEPRSEGFQLVGEYQSEGRNILSTTWFTIAKDLSIEEICAGAVKFAAQVDAEVDQSYARRLYLRFDVPAEAS
jgi:hypothetical protein